MTTQSLEHTAPTTVSAPRRLVGALRLVAGLTLLTALISQIVEKVVNNDMIAEQYFSYFTIQYTMISVVVLLAGGLLALRANEDTVLYTTVRMSVLAYAVVTAVVYNVLLRGIPDEGYVVAPWPGEIMHVWIPIFMFLDWILSPGRPRLRWTGLLAAIAYPLAWVAFTLTRTAVDGWFPYPFLDPATGVANVATYVVGIALFIVAVASLAIWYTNARSPRRAA